MGESGFGYVIGRLGPPEADKDSPMPILAGSVRL